MIKMKGVRVSVATGNVPWFVLHVLVHDVAGDCYLVGFFFFFSVSGNSMVPYVSPKRPVLPTNMRGVLHASCSFDARGDSVVSLRIAPHYTMPRLGGRLRA